MTDAVLDEVTVAGVGVTLERMLWRRDRKYTAGLAEQALDLNPGVAELGAELPVGTKVILPRPSATAPSVAVIRLKD